MQELNLEVYYTAILIILVVSFVRLRAFSHLLTEMEAHLDAPEAKRGFATGSEI